jgi:hypothetical protein
MDLVTIYPHHSELQVIIALSLMSALYKSLSHAVFSVFTSRILATDLNTVIITVSL